jgi:hypothetical protein
MVGRPGKQVARKLDVDDTNGGLRRTGAHARGRQVPGFYRRPTLAKVVRACPRVGEVVAWACGGDVGRGTAASPVVGRRMVGVRRFAQPVGARRVATGDWARTSVRSCGRTSSHQDASASGPSGGRGAAVRDAGAGNALWAPGAKPKIEL